MRNGGKAGFPPAAAPPNHIRTHDRIPLLLVVAPRVRADAKMREPQHCVDPGTRDVLIVGKISGCAPCGMDADLSLDVRCSSFREVVLLRVRAMAAKKAAKKAVKKSAEGRGGSEIVMKSR